MPNIEQCLTCQTSLAQNTGLVETKMGIRITCINKAGGWHDDPHCAISDLGWVNDADGKIGKSTRIAVYEWLKENSAHQAYVQDSYGNLAYLYPRENSGGTKFVQTYADKTWTDNLLALPECVG
jgi:hypothetical protein